MTIVEAIQTVMRANGAPMTAAKACAAITSARLYEFHTDNPASVVRNPLVQCQRISRRARSFGKGVTVRTSVAFQKTKTCRSPGSVMERLVTTLLITRLSRIRMDPATHTLGQSSRPPP